MGLDISPLEIQGVKESHVEGGGGYREEQASSWVLAHMCVCQPVVLNYGSCILTLSHVAEVPVRLVFCGHKAQVPVWGCPATVLVPGVSVVWV